MTVEEHYASVAEGSRLTRTPHGRLELLRTRELLGRVVPPSADVLDVGGATGVHAEWLAADGHRVHVVDPVAGHVSVAGALPGVTASVGDARRLPSVPGPVDVVLLLGPLYHLTSAADRALALGEAHRVSRAGGVLAAAGICRYLTALEGAATGRFPGGIAGAVLTGEYDGHLGFVPAHFHTAAELAAEVTAAGFRDVVVYGVEGPGWPALDVAGLERFEELAPAALECARLVERDPLMMHASAHLLALATR